MQLRAVGRAVLIAAAPRLPVLVLVESVDTGPGRATIRGAKQALRRRARVPHAGLGRVPGREPERMVDRAATAGLECRRRGRLLPRAPAVGRAEYRRPEMAGARGREDRPPVARIGHRVMHDVTEESRAGELPRSARGVTGERPQAFASGDQQRRPARGGAGRLLRRCHGSSYRRNATPSAGFRQAHEPEGPPRGRIPEREARR